MISTIVFVTQRNRPTLISVRLERLVIPHATDPSTDAKCDTPVIPVLVTDELRATYAPVRR